MVGHTIAIGKKTYHIARFKDADETDIGGIYLYDASAIEDVDDDKVKVTFRKAEVWFDADYDEFMDNPAIEVIGEAVRIKGE